MGDFGKNLLQNNSQALFCVDCALLSNVSSALQTIYLRGFRLYVVTSGWLDRGLGIVNNCVPHPEAWSANNTKNIALN